MRPGQFGPTVGLLSVLMPETRWQRALSDTGSLRDWKVDVARIAAAGALTIAGLRVVDLPEGSAGQAAATVAIGIAAIVLVLIGELGLNLLRADGRITRDELEEIRPQLEQALERAKLVDQCEQHVQALKELLAEKTRALAIVEAQNKVVWEALGEKLKDEPGGLVPIMNRLKLATDIVTGNLGNKKVD
jgi:hypothetical protein